MSTSVETCSVVWDHTCKSPANLSPPVAARATCFACGEHVCTSPSCSQVMRYREFKSKRICRNCASQYSIGRWP